MNGAFQAAAVDVLKSALEGYNGTIMCYGQTGGLLGPGIPGGWRGADRRFIAIAGRTPQELARPTP